MIKYFSYRKCAKLRSLYLGALQDKLELIVGKTKIFFIHLTHAILHLDFLFSLYCASFQIYRPTKSDNFLVSMPA